MDEHEVKPNHYQSEEKDSSTHRGFRLIVWGLSLAVFAAFVGLTRVHTHLGVKAVAWDKDGRDYVWRVWWRARHDMLASAPSTGFVVVYLGLIIAFLVLSALALWLALVADPRSDSADSSLVPPPTRP